MKTLTLLVASCLAVAVYRLTRRPRFAMGSSLGSASTASGSATSDTLQATEAPNAGERLQDMHLANAGLGGVPQRNDENPLRPPPEGALASGTVAPGLGDFWRGA
jgi:hypothetical protein